MDNHTLPLLLIHALRGLDPLDPDSVRKLGSIKGSLGGNKQYILYLYDCLKMCHSPPIGSVCKKVSVYSILDGSAPADP